MYKILIVEDEEVTAFALTTLLESLGYEVTDSVNNAQDALKSIADNPPDLMISDIMIKGSVSGSELAKKVYLKYKLPIIFLTAYCDDEMIQYAIDANACGYIMKPYKEHEIKAMISLAIHKLKEKDNICNLVRFEGYSFDLNTNKLYKDDQEIKLGKKSIKLLKVLTKNDTASFDTLINELWDYDDEKSIDKLRQLVKRTKEKLNITAIESIKNIGYKIHLDT